MRIGVRIAAGFAPLLLMTLAAAIIGGASFESYSNRVAVSFLTQSIVENIGRLNFETDEFVREGAPEFASAALAEQTALLFTDRFKSVINQVPARQLRASMARYETALGIYSSQKSEQDRRVSQGKLLANRLEAALYTLGDPSGSGPALPRAVRDTIRQLAATWRRDGLSPPVTLSAQTHNLVTMLQSRFHDPATSRTAHELAQLLTAYDAGFKTIGEIQAARAMLLRQMHLHMDDMLSSAGRLYQDQLRHVEKGRTQAGRLALAGATLTLLSGMIFAALITRSIVRPLSDIVIVMGRLAVGELVADIPGGTRSDELGQVARAVTVFRDNAVAMEELRRTLDRGRLQQLADVSFEGILLHEAGIILDVNEALCLLLGRTRDELIGYHVACFTAASEAAHSKDVARLISGRAESGELDLLDASGSVLPVEIHAKEIDYCGNPAIAVAVRDLTARHEAKARLVHLAHHDPLTGLPNRVMLNQGLAQAVQHCMHEASSMAVLYMDLDRFKSVNDQLGHASGDALLVAVSRRLLSCLRPADTLVRLGGDEFAVLLCGTVSEAQISCLCTRFIEALSLPFDVSGRQVVIGVSIGVALYPTAGSDGPALLRSADLAMYWAKSAGRNTYRFYDAEMDERTRRRHALAEDLRAALAGDELHMHFQPLVCSRTGRVRAFEALARWTHSEHGSVSPGVFIELAEQTGQIEKLGEWALYTACREAAVWPHDVRVAVNLSPLQFHQGHICEKIADILEQTGLPPGRLEIELTEGVLINNADEALRHLSDIKRLGVRIALDDFGTGFSSLNYLQRFPFDKIKIDKSFIDKLPGEKESLAIIRAILALGRGLGMVVVAEGVETEDQRLLLTREGCNELQGFHFSRPMSGSLIPRFLEGAGNGKAQAAIGAGWLQTERI